MTAAPVLVALTRAGGALAARLRAGLPGAEVHGLDGRVDGASLTFDDTAAHLRGLYHGARPVVGVCAAGILVRALAPVLADKGAGAPVLALAEDGSAVVPLLGGHAGANALAREIGALLGTPAAVTTAGDLRFGVALDDPPPGWRLANPQHYRPFVAKLLDGAGLTVQGDAPWLAASRLPAPGPGRAATLSITVTEQARPGSEQELVYHPRRLCLGIGCERGAAPTEVLGLVEETLAHHGLAAQAVAGVFSLDLKSDEPAVDALAEALDVPARFFDALTLEAEAARLASPSEVVFAAVGCHGVAEGAALAAAGPRGTLLVAKRRSARATCAIARAPAPIDTGSLGQARGRLMVVGLGPGGPASRTAEVHSALGAADDLVGYGGYLDLVEDTAPGVRHPFPLGAETERVHHALDLASTGHTVALVCSGDPGIYAMASLVLESLDGEPPAAWRRVALEILPGVSALQAAAARAGAPLGHDFCAISLSDLLTPWPAIERRLEAAAAGDFVVALYNPVSRRRTHQLGRALDILATARPADTPLVIARNLGREGEHVRLTRLGARDIDDVDMLTTVIVGSSQTRLVAGRDDLVYTPRGYDAAPRVRSA